MFLLDTNVVSELRKAKSGQADARVVAFMGALESSALYVSVITLMELELGVLLSERKDPLTGASLRAWFDQQVRPEFIDRTIPIDVAVAMHCAALHAQNPRSYRDALIASCAHIHGMTVITRNVADFVDMGVPLVNPWEAAP